MTGYIQQVFGTTRKRKDVLFIDPGVTGAGFAFWPSLVLGRKRTLRPTTHGCLPAPRDDWIARGDRIAEDCWVIAKTYGLSLLVVEWPTLWSGSGKSHAAAVKGNLNKICVGVGMVIHALRDWKAEVILVKPGEWKQQLSKEVVEDRIHDELGDDFEVESHAGDAVGMGLAAVGRL